MLKDHNDKNVPFFLFQGYNFYRSVCSLPKAKTWSDFHDVIDPAEVIFKLVISVSNNQIGSCLLNLNFEKKCCCKPVSWTKLWEITSKSKSPKYFVETKL